jgi:hypothetical protein
MRSTFQPLALTLAAAFAAVALLTASANAQQLKQMKLTDQQVTGFIAAQADFAPLADKLREGGDKPDPSLAGQLDEIAKKHGFKDFSEFEDVGANVTIVLDGLDPKSGTYSDPVEKMKKERDEISADTSIPEADKKLALDDLDQEIAAAQPLQFKENIDVVNKHRAAIEKLVPAQTDEPTDGAAPGPAPDAAPAAPDAPGAPEAPAGAKPTP